MKIVKESKKSIQNEKPTEVKTPSEEAKGVSKDNPHQDSKFEKVEYGLKEITKEQDDLMEVESDIDQSLNAASIKNPMKV